MRPLPMAQNHFFKANFALIIGLALPVILVLGFLVASHLPQKLGTPPQHELIFSSSRYDLHAPMHVDFIIKNKKLYMKLAPKKEQEAVYLKELFVFNGQKGSVRKIHYQIPSDIDHAGDNEILVTEFKDVLIDNNSKSPDGYEFVPSQYRSRGLWLELFGGHSGRYVPRIKKEGGASYALPDYGNAYSYGNFNFIGWMINSDQNGSLNYGQ
ncbi:hypothetical protein [Nitrosomonas sp.]|uniref:hypothetical protein n=1 Tax=Nitrosomonas sp. TaxID=42353 RepID=UPI0026045BBF|nr:hypothetical protein [Nitrosomonas sp.]MCW5599611.1 hypothetical protein [Nitrosomonas sp.]MCW5601118.1 hypothetical protein [Nitrosomonas sp.]